VYVPEESHSGIVPMSHSNKDGTSLAESEEGRLLIKENTYPPCTYPTQSGSARGPGVGECADQLFAWPLSIRDKNRMR
jgi:RNA-directed DNA polymerase